MDDPRLRSTFTPLRCPPSLTRYRHTRSGVKTEDADADRCIVNLLLQDQGLRPPQPLILDPKLRFPLDARILKVWTDVQHFHPSDREVEVRQPWIICGNNVQESRREVLEEAGARVIAVPLDAEGVFKSGRLGSTCKSGSDVWYRSYSSRLATWYSGRFGPEVGHDRRGIEGTVVLPA